MNLPVARSGHLVPFPAACLWCGEPAYESTTCPHSIRCPRCAAGPGERCRQPNGHAVELHHDRRIAAHAIDEAAE